MRALRDLSVEELNEVFRMATTEAALRAENERLQMELRANRQDTGAVIAGLQGEIKRLRATLSALVYYGPDCD